MNLYEICIITRVGKIESLGMTNRGHLGLGAIGNIATYNLDPNKIDGHTIEKDISLAVYTIKDGQIVVKDVFNIYNLK